MSFYCTGKDSAEIELHLITNLTRLIARLAKCPFVKLRSVSVAAILHIQRRAALLLGMLAVISVFLSVAPLAQTRPNIVFVLADDMGMGDFNPTLMPKTYSLFRRLGAALPMQATQRCVPTRVAVNTGLQPSRLNLHGVEPIYNYDGVPITTPMLAEYLKTARYATHVVGKWHLGLNPAQLPNRRGFDSFVGVVHGNITYYGVPENGQAYFDGTFGHAESGSHTLMRNDKAFRTTRYSTHLFGQAARTIIRKTPPERQFYLYLAFNAPHLPWSAPWPYIRAVQALAGVSDTELLNLSTYASDVAALTRRTQRQLPPELVKRLQKLLYFAIMRALDDEIASTYAALVSTGKANSTMFVFSSDNGALVDSPGDNGDLRDGKGSPYEGGHRVPTFIIWPGVVAPGAKIDGPIWIGDLFATFIAAAGGRVPGGTDSVNALPAITSGVPHIRNGTDSVVPHVSKEEVTNPTTGAKSIIGEFAINNNETQKYIRRLEFSEDATTIVGVTEELYNLRNDPQETTNRVADPLFARVLARMRNMYASFGGNAYFSGLKTYRRVPLPDGYVPPLIYMYPAYRTWDAAQAAGVVFHSDTAFQDPPASAAK